MPKSPNLESSLGPYIGRASRVLEKRINHNFARAGYEISMDHWILLFHLWVKDGQNQKALCDYAGRNKTMITRSIDSLEKQNFVLRVPDSKDRRNKLIYLTHKGKELRIELERIMLESMEEATHGVEEAELETCKRVLDKVFGNLVDEDTMMRFKGISNNRNHLK